MPPWPGSRAPSKASWHLGLAHGTAPSKASWHLGLARGRAPCKAPCHLLLARGRASSKAPWYTSHVLARPAGTMQGPVVLVVAGVKADTTQPSHIELSRFFEPYHKDRSATLLSSSSTHHEDHCAQSATSQTIRPSHCYHTTTICYLPTTSEPKTKNLHSGNGEFRVK